MTDTPDTLTAELARSLHANSLRWFPELAAWPARGRAVHYTLGLAGELGEVVEQYPAGATLGEEMADALIYALDLAEEAHVAPRLLSLDGEEVNDRTLTKAVGLLVNQVKKCNRGDFPMDDLGDRIGLHLCRVLSVLVELAASHRINLHAEVVEKVKVCEARWGNRRLPGSYTRCGSCGAQMRWAQTEEGRSIPLDPDPVPTGNLIIKEVRHVGGRGPVLTVRYLRKTDTVPLEVARYVSHFATCPSAAEHRRK